MAVDEHILGELQHLRALVGNVNGLSVQNLARSGCNRVEEIRGSADRPERFANELGAVERAVVRFAQVFSQNWMSGHAGDGRSKQAIDDAREHVSAQIDALERLLDGVELNGEKKWLLRGDASGLNQGRSGPR